MGRRSAFGTLLGVLETKMESETADESPRSAHRSHSVMSSILLANARRASGCRKHQVHGEQRLVEARLERCVAALGQP